VNAEPRVFDLISFIQLNFVGANRNKEEEFSLSLSTMPFESLRDLLNETKNSTDNELKIETCRFFSENHILVLILSILSSISHHPHRKVSPHFNQKVFLF
jgi:hypothetical protein